MKADLETEEVQIDACVAAAAVGTDVNSAAAGNVVNVEIFNDDDYDKKQEKFTENELFEVQVSSGQVESMPGEVILEVRPQYCSFSSQGLAEKLKNMKLDVTCLPWVAILHRRV